MTTYPEVDLDCAIAACMCGDATKAQQSRVYRHIEKLQRRQDRSDLFDWLEQNADVSWDMDYEKVEVVFKLDVPDGDGFDNLIDAIQKARAQSV